MTTMSDKDAAQQAEIQRRLVELTKQIDEIKALADEHKIEFSWMGMTMHYRPPYGRNTKLAKRGWLVADSEWQSSGLSCENDEYWLWRRENWPEDFDDHE